MPEITLMNFGHPLTAEQIQTTEEIIGQKIARIFELHVQLDPEQSVQPQIEKLIDSISDKLNFQIEPYLVNLPTFAIAAATVLAILHGRSGHFPSVLRIKPLKNVHPPKFVVAEIINLQAIREKARQNRR